MPALLPILVGLALSPPASFTAAGVPEPGPHDLLRFPDARATARAAELNRAYRECLRGQAAAAPSWQAGWYARAEEEAREAGQAWDCLRCAHAYGAPHWLAELRRRVGEEAWWAAALPPPVPPARFRVIGP